MLEYRHSRTHLSSKKGLEVPPHLINANRDAVNERERLRALGEHRREISRDNVAKLKLSSAYM